MRRLSIAEAREQLTRLPEILVEGDDVSAATITRHGKPVLAILPWDLYASLMETRAMGRVKAIKAALRAGLADGDVGGDGPTGGRAGRIRVEVTRWTIVLTRTALGQLARIKDKRVQQTLRKHLEGLGTELEKQGKALTDELAGYRSIRVVGQRYRIVYRLEEHTVVVYVVGVGLRREGSRRDVYAVAQQLLDRCVLDEA